MTRPFALGNHEVAVDNISRNFQRGFFELRGRIIASSTEGYAGSEFFHRIFYDFRVGVLSLRNLCDSIGILPAELPYLTRIENTLLVSCYMKQTRSGRAIIEVRFDGRGRSGIGIPISQTPPAPTEATKSPPRDIYARDLDLDD